MLPPQDIIPIEQQNQIKRNEEREKIKVKRNKHIFIDLDKKIC